MYFWYLLSGAGVGFGLFYILADLFKVPTYKTSRTLAAMENHYSTKESKINSGLEEIAKWLAKHLKLRDFKRAQIQANLNTARMSISPEMFVANCMVKAAVVGILGIPLLPIFPIGSAIAVLAAFLYYIQLSKELERRVKAHRSALEFELVQMIFTIERVLLHNRNIIQMLENYREIAGKDMKQELDITLADMKSGNQEQAISRLEIRVGSMMMSDVCRGLISIIRGDETTAYWLSLQQKFTEHQRDILKRKAEKIPAKVNRLSMTLLFSFIALWMVVLVVQMGSSMSGMFVGF